MSLAKYHEKRHFSKTPEPKGRVGKKSSRALKFVIQKHDASRLHYDFRLELEGVLKSWAVPKGPSLDPGKKSLAVQVEDHPLDYGEFEGVIPKGEYGGGTVLLWDKGTWEPIGDAHQGLRKGHLHFLLHGEKLQGEWSLVQMHGKAGGDGKNWLLLKAWDEHASSEDDVLEEKPGSVKTKRSLDEIAGDRDAVWSKEAKASGKMAEASKSTMPASLSPQLAVLVEEPPPGDEWIHEIKYDGYRFLAFVKHGEVKLITRNGNDWTAKFPRVAKSLAKLKVDSAIIDGEMVVLDDQGRSDFQALQAMLKDSASADPVLFAFDLPFCDGFDLRKTPLLERKNRLEQLLEKSALTPVINYSQHIQGDGDAVVDKACQMNLEGIVSKKIDSQYVSRRDASWVKSKCGDRQEFIVIGYTDPQGSRAGFGALLLGYHDVKNQLVYAGRVGTGFDTKMLKATLAKLEKLEQEESPTDVAPPSREVRHAHWVKPELVAEIKFTGWTRDNCLRHPVFVAFRSDKPASQIVRETPAKAPPAEKVPARKAKDERKVSKVRLSHPDKVLYPDNGVTKQQLADYYQIVSQWMLPYVVDRPLALVRCPNGVGSKCFFHRNWTPTNPAAIDKVNVGSGKSKEFHVGLHDEEGLLSLVQMGVLEIHTWGCKAGDIEHPDQLVFDLDPGPDLPWKKVIESVRLVNQTLESLGMATFLKTSGGKGFHITVPIKPQYDWDTAKSFCKTIAQSLADGSELFVANMRKDLRGGKVYIDFNRNGRSATAVAPYSTRARPGAAVSMPIAWNELAKLPSADYFTVLAAAKYLARRGQDPWREFESSRVDLSDAIGKG